MNKSFNGLHKKCSQLAFHFYRNSYIIDSVNDHSIRNNVALTVHSERNRSKVRAIDVIRNAFRLGWNLNVHQMVIPFFLSSHFVHSLIDYPHTPSDFIWLLSIEQRTFHLVDISDFCWTDFYLKYPYQFQISILS